MLTVICQNFAAEQRNSPQINTARPLGRNQTGKDRGLLGWARMEAIGIRAISEIRGYCSGKKRAAITSFYKFPIRMKHRRNSSVKIGVSSVAKVSLRRSVFW